MANKATSMRVDPGFFDNIFEKERKRLEKKLGVRLTQRKFTEFLAKKNARFEFPKQDTKFQPKEVKKLRRKKSNLNLF